MPLQLVLLLVHQAVSSKAIWIFLPYATIIRKTSSEEGESGEEKIFSNAGGSEGCSKFLTACEDIKAPATVPIQEKAAKKYCGLQK